MGRRLNLKTAAAGKNLAPVNSPAARWRRRLLGALKFLESVPTSSEWPLDKWSAGMRLHYRENVRFLCAHPPKGCGSEAKRYEAYFKRMVDSRNKT